jgi:predicted DCC family thiol-disulfide oxidoreductase YuxK
MQSLYVLYDEHCELCQRLKDWLVGQRCWIGLGVIPAGSPRARTMFPGLERVTSTSDLVVVSDAGEVYLNNHAWIMCLYALEEYRDWALRLSSPLLLPLARQAFATLSKNRATISRWIGSSEEELVRELNGSVDVGCAPGKCADASRPGLENSVRDYLQ